MKPRNNLCLVVALLMVSMAVAGCSAEPKAVNHPYKADEREWKPGCSEPPRSFEWGNKTYILQKIGNEDLEPGMKLGYLECNNGVDIQHDEGENAVYNIYTFGSPLDSEDLLYFGSWGRALYTPANPSS